MKQKEYDIMHELEDTHWWYHALHNHILHFLKEYLILETGMILDLGCGTGGLMKKLAQVFPNRVLVGADMVFNCCTRTKSKSNRFTVQANANDLPFGKERFEAVVAADLIYHMCVDEKKVLKEIHSTLSDDGVAVFNVPAFQWLSSIHDKQVEGARRYNRKDLHQLFKENNFEVVFSSYWNFFLFPLMVLSRKVLRAKGEQSDVQELPLMVQKLFKVVLMFEHKIIRKGIRFPFGGSILAIVKKK